MIKHVNLDFMNAMIDCRNYLNQQSKENYRLHKRAIKRNEKEMAAYYKGVADGFGMSASNLRDAYDPFKLF